MKIAKFMLLVGGFAGALVAFQSQLYDNSAASKFLEENGYVDFKLNGRPFNHSCPAPAAKLGANTSSGVYSTEFTGKNAKGENVEGEVCGDAENHAKLIKVKRVF